MNKKKEISIYENVGKHLFREASEASRHLTPKEMEVKARIMLCVSKKLANPLTLDSELVTFLMGGCGGACPPISNSQAYRDVAAVTRLTGNIQGATKAWYRYLIVESNKEGIAIAIKNKDPKGIAACSDKIGKYTRADKEDDVFDYENMIPPSFEPSDDVTLLENMEPIENLEDQRKEFRKLFKKKLSANAEDVTAI